MTSFIEKLEPKKEGPSGLAGIYGKFKKKRVEKRKLIESNINCYKHLGKLNDFNIIQKTTVLKKPVIPLSYADFIKQ